LKVKTAFYFQVWNLCL